MQLICRIRAFRQRFKTKSEPKENKIQISYISPVVTKIITGLLSFPDFPGSVSKFMEDIVMRKNAKHSTILIDGIRYYAEKPETCRMCFFWKNRKVGCILGKQNCYYLAEAVMTEQEKKCEGCCYAKGQPCVSATCYKDLEAWLQAKRARKEGGADE